MKSKIKKLADKFKQPSSWAGLGVLSLLAPAAFPAYVVAEIGTVGAGVCALLAFFLDEKTGNEN